MILQKARLFPFGGIVEREVDFAPGLNVILGPNEAGKSTLVGAIFAVLFFSSALRKNSSDWKDYLAPYMPYPSGDTVQVSLAFKCFRGREYVLERAWGEVKKDRLRLPDGSEVNNPQSMAELLSPLLQYGRGTYEGVFMARQAELLRTVELLRSNSEATGSIAETLRNLVFQSGGISLEALQASLQAEKNELLKLWDLQRGVPQGGRSIDNPYQRGLGEIIAAYYEVEGLKRQIREASILEERVEELTARLKENARMKQEELDPLLESMEKLEGEIQRRSVLEPKLALLQEKEKATRELNSRWPQMVERENHLRSGLQEKEKRRAALERELQEAKAVIETRSRRALYQKVKPMVEAWEEKKKELQDMPPVKQAHLTVLEQMGARISELQATLKAMKLQGRITGIKGMQLSITSGVSPSKQVSVEQEYFFEAEGRVLLKSGDWTLEIRSGQGDVAGIIEEINQTETAMRQKLQELSVQTREEARLIVEKRTEKEKVAERLRAQLETLLKDTTYRDLAKQVCQLAPEKSVRDPELIGEEFKGAAVDEKSLARELKDTEAQLKAWEKEYGSYEKVVDGLVDLRAQARDVEKELKELAPLPQEWQSPSAFIQGLQAARGKNRVLQETIYSLMRELDQAKNELPEESVEELQERLAISEKRLHNLKSRARALCIVEDEFKGILHEVGAKTFDPLVASLLKYFTPVTGYRYDMVHLVEGSIPECIGVSGGNGGLERELPVRLLSVGTTRGLALALRLAMAEHLWGGEGGFLIMDDPLVDLDPGRKKEAAKILRDFSGDRQLIITTCDPDTAQLLGGTCSMLEPAGIIQ